MEVRYNNSMLAMAKSFEIWYISIAFVEVNILSIFSLRNVSHKLAPLRLEIARQSNDYTLNITAHHPPPPASSTIFLVAAAKSGS